MAKADNTKSTPKKAASKAASGKSGSGLAAPLSPDDKLAAVVGSQPLPRTEIVKKLWDYIKANGLQDTTNKRMINADDKLKAIFDGKKQVSMFEIAGFVNKHIK